MSSARATWKGFLKISLVTVPIKVIPATDSAGAISFNQLHADCRTRLQQKRYCPHCEKDVPASAIVKGYEFEPGHYVLVDDADLERVRPESTRVIELAQFADERGLDPMHVDRTYYLEPDGPAAATAYAVLCEGIRGKVGIGKLAIYGREYLVAVRAIARVLTLHTLHHAGELRTAPEVPHTIVRPKEIALARQVIASLEQPLDLADYRDEYRAQLQEIIDAKIHGRQIVTPPAPATPATLNLAAALRESLDAVSRAKKPTAKASPVRRRRAS